MTVKTKPIKKQKPHLGNYSGTLYIHRLGHTVAYKNKLEHLYLISAAYDPTVHAIARMDATITPINRRDPNSVFPSFLTNRGNSLEAVLLKQKEFSAKRQNAEMQNEIEEFLNFKGIKLTVLNDDDFNSGSLIENLQLLYKYADADIEFADVLALHDYLSDNNFSTIAEAQQFLLKINRPADLVFTFLYHHILWANLIECLVTNDSTIVMPGLLMDDYTVEECLMNSNKNLKNIPESWPLDQGLSNLFILHDKGVFSSIDFLSNDSIDSFLRNLTALEIKLDDNKKPV